MKIINLGRGRGKTTRLLYASEWQNIPILCPTHAQKEYLIEMSKRLGLCIPEPITAGEIGTGTIRLDRDILVDEAPLVLQCLLRSFGVNGEVKAITLTEKD